MSTVYTVNGKVLKNAANDKWLIKATPVDPYNPLGLPPNTVRVRTNDGNAPNSSSYYETATLVPDTTNEYDVYKSGTSLDSLLKNCTNIVAVLGANTTGITNMAMMFRGCTALRTVSLFNTSNVTSLNEIFCNCYYLNSVPLFDTSNVTNMSQMFYNCIELTYLPLFNTSKVTDINDAFAYCYAIQSGALALYQQASTQTNPPSSHINTFKECGKNTTTGAAELAQIPYSWGGTEEEE